MRSKKYQEIKKKIEEDKIYSLDEAIDFIKRNARKTFDETVEVHLKLNLSSTSKSFGHLVSLPSGSYKKTRIAAFVSKELVSEAKEAGADIVGGEELIEKIKGKGEINFEKVVASPQVMSKLVKIAKILGPRGLMPDPKKGEVTEKIKEAIERIKGGEIFYKADKGGNIHLGLAKVSWEKEKIKMNVEAFLESVEKTGLKGLKESFIKQAVLSTSMGPGLKIKI